MIANYRVQAELSAIACTEDGRSLVLGGFSARTQQRLGLFVKAEVFLKKPYCPLLKGFFTHKIEKNLGVLYSK